MTIGIEVQALLQVGNVPEEDENYAEEAAASSVRIYGQLVYGRETGPGRGKARPFLARVVDPSDRRRVGRLSDHTATILNSLMGKGQLQQTGQVDWEIRSGGFVSTRAPNVHDDVLEGISVGATWVDQTGKQAYVCISNALNAAVWKQTTV